MIRLLRYLSKITGKEVYCVYIDENKISDVSDIDKYSVLEAQHSFKKNGSSFKNKSLKKS